MVVEHDQLRDYTMDTTSGVTPVTFLRVACVTRRRNLITTNMHTVVAEIGLAQVAVIRHIRFIARSVVLLLRL